MKNPYIHVLTSFGILLLGISTVAASISFFLVSLFQPVPFSLLDLFVLFSIGLIEIYVIATEYRNYHSS